MPALAANAPLKELLAPRISVPAPVLVTPKAPEIPALTVNVEAAVLTSKFPEEASAKVSEALVPLVPVTVRFVF